MANLNFSIALNLLTNQFKKGVNSIKSGFTSIRMQVATFAAALQLADISISGFASKLIETARATNRAVTALKNVSPSTSTFVKNQQWLIQLSEKYGTDVNTLTGEFAKFTAAANQGNIPLNDQRKIFESVDRACGAFALSAEDTNSVFLALTQMMGKGKIQAQELRLQMGEKLPVAINAMAMAAGVSVAQMENLMKSGKLLAKDVLPGFADALNKMLPNVDTNNLETSINRMGNAFTSFVKNTSVQSAYKSLIDGITNLIRSATNSISSIVSLGWSAIIGMIASKGAKLVSSIWSLTASVESRAVKSNANLIAATRNRISAEITLEKAKADLQIGTDGKIIEGERALKIAEINLEKAKETERKALKEMSLAVDQQISDKRLANAALTSKKLVEITRARILSEKRLKEAETLLLNADTAEQRIALQKRVEATSKTLSRQMAAEARASATAIAAANAASAVRVESVWTKAGNAIKVGAVKVGEVLKNMWSTYGVMAFITAIGFVISRMVQLREDAERIKNLWSEYKNNSAASTHTAEINQTQALLEHYNKIKSSVNSEKIVRGQINSMFNQHLKNEKEVNDFLRERIGLLRIAARAEFGATAQAQADLQSNNIISKFGNAKNFNYLRQKFHDKAQNAKLLGFESDNAYGDFNRGRTSIKGLDGKRYRMSDIWSAMNEYNQQRRISFNAHVISVANSTPPSKGNTTEEKPKALSTIKGNKDTESELEKEMSNYAKSLRELAAKKEVEKMTDDDYNKAYDELNKSALVEAMSSNDKQVLTSKYIESLKMAVANPLYSEADAQLDKVKEEYQNNISIAAKQLKAGAISQKEYDDQISDYALEAANNAIKIKGIGDKADSFVKEMLNNAKLPTPEAKQRDTTFDYSKTATDIAEEKLDLLKARIEELKNLGKRASQEAVDELNKDLKEVDTEELALKIVKVKNDITNFQKDLGNTRWDGIKDMVSSIDNVKSSFESLVKAVKGHSNLWDGLMSAWSIFSTTIDTINGVIETMKRLKEITSALSAAKQAEAAIDTATTATKVTNAAMGTTAALGAAAAEKGANETTVAGNIAAAGSEVVKNNAKIPIVGIALAVAGLGAIFALWKMLPKFANGGIIGGGSTIGDNSLARVNAGEMILNGRQQSNLFKAINSGRIGNSTKIQLDAGFVRGDKMYIAIKNYMKSSGNKL